LRRSREDVWVGALEARRRVRSDSRVFETASKCVFRVRGVVKVLGTVARQLMMF
jgi:hypothetical protein